MSLALPNAAAVDHTSDDPQLHARIDDVRVAMESEMEFVRQRALTYLRWYSPPYDTMLKTHDAWTDDITAEDVDLTRANFPIARACVDIWAALEAAKPMTVRAEPERIPQPPPTLDQNQEMQWRLVYEAIKTVESRKSDLRSAEVRRWLKLDGFPLKHFTAVRRKNLYGFSWVKILPSMDESRPVSYVVKNPTTVFPLWSSRDPEDMEMVLCAYQMSAIKANAMYGLGLPTKNGKVIIGQDNGRYRELNDRWYDSTRTMVWVEELWWIDRDYDASDYYRVTSSRVNFVNRVAGQIVNRQTFEGWRYLPFIYYVNEDERDSYGWSDIASVIDINDELNRRLSQEGDIIGMYSAPRFQMLNAMYGEKAEMPGPFELIPLSDQKRIEQILTRIDVFPTQVHWQVLTDLLHRVSGLPPIVWGLIANAQTSGRALTASWKATETRLTPKLMANERAARRRLAISQNYAMTYKWRGADELFLDSAEDPFRDWSIFHPPMEPRDFQEVTMDAITRRDAGLTTTVKAMRDTGDEAAEDTLEEVKAEFMDVFIHPDKVQAALLAQRAQIDNMMQAQQMQMAQQQAQQAQQPMNTATAMAAGAAAGQPPPTAVGEGPLPPTQAGAEGNAAQPPQGGPGSEQLTSGTLMRQGDVSNQFLQTRRY